MLLGGAPGIGKTAVAREFLSLAVGGTVLTQWVDVDAGRPELDDFYRSRYYEAQRTPSDHVLHTDGKIARAVAAERAALLAD